MTKQFTGLGLAALLISVAPQLKAHEGHDHSHEAPKLVKVPLGQPIVLPHTPEKSGPVKVAKGGAGSRVSGQGYWKFTAEPNLVPLPEATKPHVKGAHGTLVWDKERDLVYWGLQNFGWIRYANGLTLGEPVQGDPKFTKGNLHGADLLPRRGKAPLIAVADDVENEVYLTDSSFQTAKVLGWPKEADYTEQKQFKPTDVAFTGKEEIYVTDGYGKAFFMPAQAVPDLQYKDVYFGGKDVSRTPHGITLNPKDGTLILAARPEGQIQRWNRKKVQETVEILQLPPGSTVCDVDVWGDYALAPCLLGPNQVPGPIYIVNLKKKTIASIIRVKEELGYSDAQHIHDAIWYIQGKGSKQQVYIVFTNWNPGGVGALRLVNLPD